MINVYLATDLENPVRQYKSVYQYAKEELDAREGTTLCANHKAIATGAYINLNGKKTYRKMYSALFGCHIQLRRIK